MSRKILYSPGFGAGWTTWNHDPKVKAYMLTYKPIIKFLEGGGKFTNADCHEGKKLHPILKQLQQECKKKFKEDYVCVLGADDLKVISVAGRVRIEEYDGSESIEEEGEFSNWL